MKYENNKKWTKSKFKCRPLEALLEIITYNCTVKDIGCQEGLS